MVIAEIDGTHKVTEVKELEAVLSKRHAGKNCFWMGRFNGSYPVVAFVVKDDIASVRYFSKGDDAGSLSMGAIPGMDPKSSTAFSISRHSADDIEIMNDNLIPFQLAVTVAKEFFVSPDERPSSINWLET